MNKRFIEWNLPLAEISEESAKEKSIRYGHPSTLHIWWARRPLASSRATNFAALIDLPNDKQKQKEIFELIKKITPWNAVKNGNDKNIKKAQEMISKQWKDSPPKVLDPFAGGGSIPLEALRLGCETYANDYNPVAVFIEKATFEWPQKLGISIPHPGCKKGVDGEIRKIKFLPFMLDKWANIILEKTKEEIGNFYPNEPDGSIPVGYIWVRTILCQNPTCGSEIPLARQFWLADKSDKKIAYKPLVDKINKKINFEIVSKDMGNFNPKDGTSLRGNARCLVCGQITDVQKVRELAQKGEMGQRLVAVVLHHPDKKGKIYRVAQEKDFEIYNKCEEYLKKKVENWAWPENPIPDEDLPLMSGVFNVPLYGIDKWNKLFNSRQKLALITFMEKIKLSYEEIKKDCNRLELRKYGVEIEEAAKSIIQYLCLSLDRMADYNSNITRWVSNGEFVGNTFTRQALPMIWDFNEINPFSGMTGDWQSAKNWILGVIEGNSWSATAKNTIINSSAHSLPFQDCYFDAVFTDPPYYNSVPYADLSDFFYVWLKRSAGQFFPDLFSTPLTPKTSEICEMSGWDSRRYSHKNKEFFERMLSDSFKEIYRVLKPDGIATIVYAHKTTAGWETMLNSLVNAGLVVTASWPIHTEMKDRMRAKSSAALASSIYMVCRKTDRKKVGFFSEIKPQIKERIENKLQQFWNEGISGGDFFISAIGPGMEIYSQYEKVEKLSGENVTTTELLDFIRSVSTNFIVSKLLKDASSTKIDNESEFYLAYRWTYLDNTVEYDDARKLASASGVSLEELWESKGFIRKSGSTITVLGPKDRENIDSPRNMVDVMHKCLLLWEQNKKGEISELLSKTGFAEKPAFKQFCQAVAESLLNGNKEKQLLEGFLIGIDNYKGTEVKISKAQTDLKQYGVR